MNSTDEAAEWFIAQRTGKLSAEERERFIRWLGDSAANVREYLAIAELWGSLPAGADVRSASTEDLKADLHSSNAIASLSSLSASLIETGSRARKRFGWAQAALAACLLVAIGGVAWLITIQVKPEEVITRRGEQRSMELPDGSVLQLNAMSHVVVTYDERARRVQLRQGEALFRVAKDSSRPFEVTTADAVVRAIGTTFNVYYRGGDTRVAVVEGKVHVLAHQEPVGLTANEAAHVSKTGPVVRAPVEAQKVIAWTQRRLIFDEEPLAQVVDQFNLYNVEQFSLEDEELRRLRINGVFDADDPQALVAYLQRVQSVEVEHKKNGIRLRRSNAH